MIDGGGEHRNRDRASCCLASLLILFAPACHGNRFAEGVVNCRTLSEVPIDRLDDFDSRTLLSSLEPSEARVALRWTVGGVEHALISPVTTGDVLPNLFEGWAVGARLACAPEASVFVHLAPSPVGTGPLRPGSYDFNLFGFDVPSLEQGGNTALPPDTSGTVVIESVEDNLVTGYLDGRGQTPLVSFFGQEPLNITVEITSLAFRDVPLLADY
jgi:hypothetical protein